MSIHPVSLAICLTGERSARPEGILLSLVDIVPMTVEKIAFRQELVYTLEFNDVMDRGEFQIRFNKMVQDYIEALKFDPNPHERAPLFSVSYAYPERVHP